jgi:hypothetical protein
MKVNPEIWISRRAAGNALDPLRGQFACIAIEQQLGEIVHAV